MGPAVWCPLHVNKLLCCATCKSSVFCNRFKLFILYIIHYNYTCTWILWIISQIPVLRIRYFGVKLTVGQQYLLPCTLLVNDADALQPISERGFCDVGHSISYHVHHWLTTLTLTRYSQSLSAVYVMCVSIFCPVIGIATTVNNKKANVD